MQGSFQEEAVSDSEIPEMFLSAFKAGHFDPILPLPYTHKINGCWVANP